MSASFTGVVLIRGRRRRCSLRTLIRLMRAGVAAQALRWTSCGYSRSAPGEDQRDDQGELSDDRERMHSEGYRGCDDAEGDGALAVTGAVTDGWLTVVSRRAEWVSVALRAHAHAALASLRRVVEVAEPALRAVVVRTA